MPGGALYRTTDGGRRWARVELPAPAEEAEMTVAYGTPRFFSSRSGVVPAVFSARSGAARKFVLYATSDGGQNWAARQVPADAGEATYSSQNWWVPTSVTIPWSAVNMDDWYVYVGPKLYRTTDGGRTWTATFPRPTWSAPGIYTFDFSSQSTGWALVGSLNDLSFVRTTDGGRTWENVAGSG